MSNSNSCPSQRTVTDVTSTGELKQLLAKHKGGDGVSLLVQRSKAGMMVLKMV
jgi:hypothetical protein